ncbi:MAG TPA: TonB-dependent receptor [Williamwhitmania sp.]|nr:TonB-dependent receptor [Williamwhitmania sp.]
MNTIKEIIDHSCFILSLILRSCFSFVILLMLFAGGAVAQPVAQVVKGKVVDGESQVSLPGANVVILDTDPVMGGVSDANGNFRIANVPVGRYNIQVSFVGYDPVIVPEILVTSGKEVVLNVNLRQSVAQLDGVTVKAQLRKDRPLNNMAPISARSFTVEETRRYAGGLDDPARMASAFAGVTVGDIQDNAIIIRGNSPKGVSWRLEGVEVPNPNHFAGGNVAGGGFVTIFSSQMLANSDFFTGAFPAEYGNALAGVFDMKLRTGNSEKRESTFQAGVMGIDIASEGPFKKGGKASYLFNYRYSTTAILSKMKVIPSDQVPAYQDLSFKLNFPTAKSGTFSLWAIGAIDNNKEPEEADSTKWNEDWDRVWYRWDLYTGAIGLTHRLTLGTQTYLNTTVAASGTSNMMDMKRLGNNLILRPEGFYNDDSWRLTFSTFVNRKVSSRLTLKSGIAVKQLFYRLNLNGTIDEVPDTYQNFVKENGNSTFAEAYVESRYSIGRTLSLDAGINGSFLSLNGDYSIDPRFGFRWAFAPKHALSFGYGKHSQMEELKVYMVRSVENGSVSLPNKDLKFSHAHHFVLGYDWRISENIRIKVEAYYQYLFDIPGIADSSYSMINFKQDWSFHNALKNNSVGKNRGVDITLERFLNRNFYYLLTASIFDSRYRGDDGVWRNTRYNKRYAFNALVGKEFFLSRNRVFGFNVRLNYIGGERYSPTLIQKSLAERRVFTDEYRAFEKQFPDTYYLDFSLTYRTNHGKYSGTWALQIKNALGSPQYWGDYYDYKTNSLKSGKITVTLPVLSYKVDF